MIAKLASVSQMPAPACITAIENENYRTKTFTLDVRLDAEPGQFVMVWLPRFDEKPFSLVNANPVTLMISAVLTRFTPTVASSTTVLITSVACAPPSSGRRGGAPAGDAWPARRLVRTRSGGAVSGAGLARDG